MAGSTSSPPQDFHQSLGCRCLSPRSPSARRLRGGRQNSFHLLPHRDLLSTY